MERLNKAIIKSGKQYDQLFPEPNWQDTVINGSADLADTMKLIPRVVNDTLADTEKIASLLKGKNTLETARNIWHFVYEHIPYQRDERGKEQVRRPSRSWFERKTRMDGSAGGVDCDCYTVFISSILTNLDIAHTLRITKNTKDYFQHIYPIIQTGNGRYITIDCVVDEFNYEAPYKEKIDHTMELHYLNGLDDEAEFYYDEDEILDYTDADTVDVQDFIDGIDMDELGFLRKLHKKVGTAVKKVARKVGTVAKKGLHVVNRINPAAVLLRNGVLAAMKLNMFKVAEKLRYAYLSEPQAKAKNLNIDKYKRLLKVQDRLAKIFYGAGGKPENLRKAILTGKGNKNKEVAGLGELFDGGAYDENSSLEEVLGPELFQEELVEDFDQVEGLGELGEIATGTAIAAASGAVGAIAALLKSIGEVKNQATTLVRKPTPAPAPAPVPLAPRGLPPQSLPQTRSLPQRSMTLAPRTSSMTALPMSRPLPLRTSTALTRTAPVRSLQMDESGTSSVPPSRPDAEPESKGLVGWAKENPVKAGLAGAGILAAGYGIYHVASGSSKSKGGLSGVRRKRKKPATKKKSTRKSNTKRKSGSKKKVTIALM
jgi:hypothetical protein